MSSFFSFYFTRGGWYSSCRAAFSSVVGCFGMFVAGAEGLSIVGGFVRASAAVGT